MQIEFLETNSICKYDFEDCWSICSLNSNSSLLIVASAKELVLFESQVSASKCSAKTMAVWRHLRKGELIITCSFRSAFRVAFQNLDYLHTWSYLQSFGLEVGMFLFQIQCQAPCLLKALLCDRRIPWKGCSIFRGTPMIKGTRGILASLNWVSLQRNEKPEKFTEWLREHQNKSCQWVVKQGD